jgi:hypothetical protein
MAGIRVGVRNDPLPSSLPRPAALHRLPETVAHVAEALWMQALQEGKRRAFLEQRDSARLTELDKQRLELRSHVLTLRKGELDSRLRDRDRMIEDLHLRLRELTGLLHKEQATRELQLQRVTTLTAPPGGAEHFPQFALTFRGKTAKLQKWPYPARRAYL